MEIMNLVMGTVNSEANIYERYGVDSFVNFYTACVDPRYQGQGIATEIYERALRMVRANKKYAFVKSNLTSPWTRRICNNFGFVELSRAYYNDFKDENGGPLVIGKKDDEFVAFMCLKL
jgi:GNAT superfamily N-acetyltransferase